MNAVLDNIEPLGTAASAAGTMAKAIILAALAFGELNRHWDAIRKDLGRANGQ